MRLALGISYNGQSYLGWQSQPSGQTIQDQLEKALSEFCAQPVTTLCAGRTDAGVHGLMQVVHLDTDLVREPFSWVRGTNRFLPADIAVQWAQPVPAEFHSRASAIARRYAYVLLESPVRPSVDAHRAGWVFRPMDGEAMRRAAERLIGEHDFSAFRAAECQAASPVRDMHAIRVTRRRDLVVVTLRANALLVGVVALPQPDSHDHGRQCHDHLTQPLPGPEQINHRRGPLPAGGE